MPGWKQTPDNRCLPFDEWPEQDRIAWLSALEPAGFLDAGGVAAAWAEGGRIMAVSGYGRWLTWLERTDRLDLSTSPADRVSRDTVIAYADALAAAGNAPMTVQSRIHQLGRALRALAPGADWSWLSRAADRIRADAVPVREKRSRLQSTGVATELGVRLTQIAAATDDYFAVPRATLYRDGLMIAVLAHRAFRRRNFSSITLGEHLIRQHDGWRFDFLESKTTRIQAPFPEELVPCLETYLNVHRPILLIGKPVPGVVRAPTQALWIAKGGQQMGADAISFQIKTHTRKAFGKDLSPHLFRDCTATSVAIDAPDQVHDIQILLGHSSLTPAEKHYNQAQTLEAGRRYQATIKKLRRPKKGPTH